MMNIYIHKLSRFKQKNNANFYTKTGHKTPWIIVPRLQMVFWVEISLEVVKFYR